MKLLCKLFGHKKEKIK
ncbi:MULTISPECIES: DUF1660 family phage protein [Lactococcus]|nr:DUF1660 family phage protein [Lactococcus lactis]MDT2858359.1 DUF1660 family phage protein [Lactococcus lactis]